jgi:NAD(P)-dependent dehydrogenase (short-subunit alcohol dehydrogenase family)
MAATSGRRALVTGAASGIGRAVVKRLVAEGVSVLAVDIDAARLEQLGVGQTQTLAADLADPVERARVADAGAGADYLVNAAGIIRLKPILEITLEDLRDVYAVNVEAVWMLCQAIGQSMPSGGAIVNLSSSSAKLATTTEAAAYASSKAAVLSITRSFAYAYAPRQVRVNAVCPGIIDTPMQERVLEEVAARRGLPVDELRQARTRMVPLERAASAEECAGLIWFLLSDESAYMTGQAINFSGGLVMW